MRLIVTVKEGVEDIVKPNLLKVDDYYFKSLFHKVTVDAKNFVEKSSWVHIENSDDLLADHSAAPRRNASRTTSHQHIKVLILHNVYQDCQTKNIVYNVKIFNCILVVNIIIN
jgi:hypothetical protein